MIKKIIDCKKGITPSEAVIIIGISAAIASIIIFTVNAPKPISFLPEFLLSFV